MSAGVRVVTWALGLTGFLLSFSTLVFLGFKLDKTNAVRYNYNITVMSITFSDLLICLALIIVAVADAVYFERYVENDTYWQSGVMCYAAAFMSNAANIMSCITLYFLALSRYRVIKQPFDTMFLEIRFVTRWIILISILCLLTSFGLVMAHRFISTEASCKGTIC